MGILAWGYNRARPYGKAGVLAWLQSVVLMTPWLLFCALFAAGVYVNLVTILFFLVTCVGLYIYLGQQVRIAAVEQKEEMEKQTPKEPISPPTSESPPGE
jgi:hypothetical protein